MAPEGSIAERAPRATIAEPRPTPGVPRRLRRFLSLDDFQAAARRHLPRMLVARTQK